MSPTSALPASTGYSSYRNTLLASALKVVTDRLQRVLNAAAHLVTSQYQYKYNQGLSRLLHSELDRFDVPEKVQYKLGVIMCSCLHG